jgi:hypothetical protein
MVVDVAGEHFLDHGRFRRLDRDAGRIAGAIRVEPVAVRWPAPRQQAAGAQLRLPTAAHALGDQRALVLGHRAADLQEQLVLRVPAHRPVQEGDLAAEALELPQQDHELDVVARQAVGIGDQHLRDLARPHRIAQPIQARAVEGRAAEAVIAEDGLARQLHAPGAKMGAQPFELLLDGLGLRLPLGRHPDIDRHRHGSPPAAAARRCPAAPGVPFGRSSGSSPGRAGRPDPTGAPRPPPAAAGGGLATGASWAPPRSPSVSGTVPKPPRS